MKNVFGILWLEHRLLACAPSRFVTCCFQISAECNSAGHTDLEVYVPEPQTAGRIVVGQPRTRFRACPTMCTKHPAAAPLGAFDAQYGIRAGSGQAKDRSTHPMTGTKASAPVPQPLIQRPLQRAPDK